jgi:hypothetical protein
MGGKSSKVTVGYRYKMGLHAGISHGPADALVEIRGGDVTLWSGTQSSSGSITINAPNAYGGDKGEGGVQGKLDVMMGESTQAANAYLTSVIGGLQPAYRGLLSVVFNGGLIASNNPYPKPWSFRVRRATQGWDSNNPWYTAKAQITLSNGVKAMNPAHIVYEVLTNRDWGMGYPAGIIDTTAFQAAADQLYTEGLGLCLLWLRQDTIESFLQLVMNYAGGVLVQSKTTGLFQFNLIRGGYSIGSLPTITRDDILSVDSLESASVTGATNEIVVNWFDPTTKTKRVTTLQALGAIQAQGVVISDSRDYNGIASLDLASRLAQRELRAVSVPLRRLKLKLDRSAWQFLPGGLFVLNFTDLGISNMVFRIGEVDYGTLTQGAITVTAVQDVFSLPDTAYIAVQNTGWTVPDMTPTASPYSQGVELNYRQAYQGLTASDLAGLSNTAGYAGVLASRPSGLATDYQIWTAVSPAAFQQYGSPDFCPTATIQSAIQPFDTALTLLAGVDLDNVQVPCAALIDNEEVNVTALDPIAGTATITRGCLDTVPAAHAAGARIWFYDGGFTGSDGVQYFSGEVVQQRALTQTTRGGTLALGLAPNINVTIAGRQAKPYPPAFLQVNSVRWDQVVKISGSLTLAWRERNRVTQQDQMIDQTQGTITPESGTTYTIVLKDGSGTTFATFTGVTGTSWTWTTPDDTHSTVQLSVTAVRGGISSWQSQTLPSTSRVGYGLNYGTDYGSI